MPVESPDLNTYLCVQMGSLAMMAEALGMDTTARFLNELEGYRKQLAQPYLVDEEAKEVMML